MPESTARPHRAGAGTATKQSGAPAASGRIILGLGGNVGSDVEILGRFVAAARAFAAWGAVRASPVYRTAAIGGPEQPDFLNAALSLRVEIEPQPAELAVMVGEVERLLGRDRTLEVHQGPRPIDVDVLLWGDRVGRWELGDRWLEVPHPRLITRRFALRPLADLLGEALIIPGGKRRVGALLDEVAEQELEETPYTIAV